MKEHSFKSDADIFRFCKDWDVVFQTFPTFESQQYMSRVAMEICTYGLHPKHIQSNWVRYDGTPESEICRSSCLFGMLSTESVADRKRGGKGEKRLGLGSAALLCKKTVFKIDPRNHVAVHSPAAMPSNFVLVGRHATWTAHQKAHRAYSLTRSYLKRKGWLKEEDKS